MGLHHIRELQAELQFGQPDGHLIGTELPVSQLHIQQPVIQIGGLRAFSVEQEFLFRLLAQDLVFDSVLVVDQLHLLYAGKLKRLKVVAQLLLGVVPEDDPVPVEEFGQGLGNAVTHETTSLNHE